MLLNLKAHLISVNINLFIIFLLVGCNPSKKNVIIRTAPNRCTVYLNEKKVGLSPIEMELSAGIYKIRLEKLDFFSMMSTITVYSNNVFTYILAKRVESIPIKYNFKPTKFFINGKSTVLKKEIINIPIGPTEIVAYREKYPILIKNINIKLNKRLPIVLEFKKTKKGSDISISSIPNKAKVFWHGLEFGETPMDFKNLYPGRYQWEIRKEGYQSEFVNIGLSKRERRAFKIKLIQNKFKLSIMSDQRGKINLLDKKRVHLLSKNIDNKGFQTELLSGRYIIEFEQPSTRTQIREIELFTNTFVKFDNFFSYKLEPIKSLLNKKGLSKIRFILPHNDNVLAVDIDKGVLGEKKHYSPPIYASDWKGCFILNNELYLCDSLEMHKISLIKTDSTQNDQWKTLFRFRGSFLKGVFRFKEGSIFLLLNNKWKYIQFINNKKTTQKLEDMDVSHVFPKGNEVNIATHHYFNRTLYLLSHFDNKIYSLDSLDVPFKTIQLTHPNVIIEYDYLQVDDNFFYLWSQKKLEIHLFNKTGKYWGKMKLNETKEINSFLFFGGIFWLGSQKSISAYKLNYKNTTK